MAISIAATKFYCNVAAIVFGCRGIHQFPMRRVKYEKA